MKLLTAIARAFTPLDTREADQAIAAAVQSQHDVAVRARALRMDLSCGDPIAAIEKLAGSMHNRASHALQAIYASTLQAPLTPDLKQLLDQLD